jgi:hypothetical protein
MLALMDSTLSDVAAKFGECCSAVGARKNFPWGPAHNGSAHVERHGAEYVYIVTERGNVLETRRTLDAEELVYWLMSNVVFDLACDFEVQHRAKGRSFRRMLFAKEIELMSQIDPSWGQRKAEEIEAILAKAPYDDAIEG